MADAFDAAAADAAAVGAAAAREIEELYMPAWAENDFVHVLLREARALFGPSEHQGWRQGLYHLLANRAWCDRRTGVVYALTFREASVLVAYADALAGGRNAERYAGGSAQAQVWFYGMPREPTADEQLAADAWVNTVLTQGFREVNPLHQPLPPRPPVLAAARRAMHWAALQAEQARRTAREQGDEHGRGHDPVYDLDLQNSIYDLGPQIEYEGHAADINNEAEPVD